MSKKEREFKVKKGIKMINNAYHRSYHKFSPRFNKGDK